MHHSSRCYILMSPPAERDRSKLVLEWFTHRFGMVFYLT